MINLNGFASLLDPRMSIYRLSFIGGGAVIKPLPVWDEEQGTLTQCIEDVNYRQLGKWITCYPVISLPTIQGLCRFIPYDPFDISSMYTSPAYKLYSAIAQAKASGIAPPTWGNLFVSQRDRQETMARGSRGPTIELENYFIIGSVIASMDNRGVPNTPLSVIHLTKSAGINLKNVILNDNVQDILEANNKVIRITPSAGGRQADGSMRPSQYLVEVNEQQNVSQRAGMLINMVSQEHISWNKLLKVLNPQEQMFVILSSTIPTSAVVYALKDEYADMIPSGYLAAGERRLEEEMSMPKTGAFPYTPPPAQYPQPHTPPPAQYPQPQQGPQLGGMYGNQLQLPFGVGQQNPTPKVQTGFPGSFQQPTLPQNPFMNPLQGGYGMPQFPQQEKPGGNLQNDNNTNVDMNIVKEFMNKYRGENNQ